MFLFHAAFPSDGPCGCRVTNGLWLSMSGVRDVVCANALLRSSILGLLNSHMSIQGWIDYHYRISNLNVHARTGLQLLLIEVEVYSFISIFWRPPSPNAVQQMGRITAKWILNPLV